ncbi:hypothetical protein DET61_11677 [Marinobacter nauticus]|uniref:Uncharacterized protein n=2 Tax=Marinobacter nauticus TaxID=2743 RepID=A0A368X9X2_MARNT|nr:hypothetical protein DET61_11677 [Marinobacter nauticus]
MNDLIKGMSPFAFMASLALLVIPHLVSVSESEPFYPVWDQLLNPMTMYVMPIFGLLVSAAFGLPTRRQFLAAMSVSVFGTVSMMTAFYFLPWAAALAAMFVVIIPVSVWIFNRVMGRGAN